MRMRSLLFVPGDRPDRFEKAATSGADIFIIDLEDSVSAANKQRARDALVGKPFLSVESAMFVRINPIGGEHFSSDLEAVRLARPCGIVLPKCEGPASVQALSRRLRAIGLGSLPILPIATETPASVFTLGCYSDVSELICGLAWGAEDLPAAVGALTARDADGQYTAPYEMVRSLTLFGAHTAHVHPIETVYPDFRDEDGLGAYARRGRRDGFLGMMAIHPNQVSVINKAFTPDESEVARAREIIAAFNAKADAGVIEIGGKMMDLPHLNAALNVVRLADDMD